MAIGIQFSLHIRTLNPKFQINLTKNNFAKGPKQKPVAECCRSAKFGGAQAKQGRALATLFLGQIIWNFGFKILGWYGIIRPFAILLKKFPKNWQIPYYRYFAFKTHFQMWVFKAQKNLFTIYRPSMVDLEQRASQLLLEDVWKLMICQKKVT